MVQVVLESSLHDCFIRLLGQYKRIFVITIPIGFIFLRVLIDCFELIRFVEGFDVCCLLLSFINTSLLILDGCGDELIAFGRLVFEVHSISNFEDFNLACRMVWHSCIYHYFLIFFNEFKWVGWPFFLKIVAHCPVNFNLCLLVILLLVDDLVHW